MKLKSCSHLRLQRLRASQLYPNISSEKFCWKTLHYERSFLLTDPSPFRMGQIWAFLYLGRESGPGDEMKTRTSRNTTHRINLGTLKQPQVIEPIAERI
ncbi:hypothetical protein Csa_003268 [Cucumis sativus]|uniref:Uncharacterized protein n=1 Tax=Cucumis sativus TaxID=3659 RepID=A0A0A0KJU2_CUCSA|nr:hypothetical protein Csa_003268 [Cucumis sativus]